MRHAPKSFTLALSLKASASPELHSICGWRISRVRLDASIMEAKIAGACNCTRHALLGHLCPVAEAQSTASICHVSTPATPNRLPPAHPVKPLGRYARSRWETSTQTPSCAVKMCQVRKSPSASLISGILYVHVDLFLDLKLNATSYE